MTCLPVLPICGFLHFQPEVGPFAGSLADAGENGISAVLLGDAGDQFLDDDGLAQPRPAEQAGLAAAKERREQIDDLDAGLEDLGLGGEIDELGRLAMDGPAMLGGDRAAVVDGFAEQIEDAAEGFLADGDGQRRTGVDAIHAASKAVGAAEGDGSDASAAEVLLRPRRRGAWSAPWPASESMVTAL